MRRSEESQFLYVSTCSFMLLVAVAAASAHNTVDITQIKAISYREEPDPAVAKKYCMERNDPRVQQLFDKECMCDFIAKGNDPAPCRKLTISTHGGSHDNQREETQQCGLADYAEGSWSPIEKTKKNYVCCNWDRDAGSAENCQKGEPVTMHGVTLERSFSGASDPHNFIMSGGHSCSCDSQPSTPDRVLDMEKYEWRPANCHMEAFDSGTFCSSLGDRTMVFLGDSTAEQAGASLMNMIKQSSGDGLGCGGKIQVQLLDTLGMAESRVSDADMKFAGPAKLSSHGDDSYVTEARVNKYIQNIKSAVQSSTEGDILVLSAGPHFGDNVKWYGAMLDQVKEAIEEKRKQASAPLFLWKTISGAGCGSIGSSDGLSSENAKKYGWGGFLNFDNMAAAAMQSLSPPVPVVNVSMLYYRGDAHPGSFDAGDCLHFCAPGPLDVVAPILSHVLRLVLR